MRQKTAFLVVVLVISAFWGSSNVGAVANSFGGENGEAIDTMESGYEVEDIDSYHNFPHIENDYSTERVKGKIVKIIEGNIEFDLFSGLEMEHQRVLVKITEGDFKGYVNSRKL